MFPGRLGEPSLRDSGRAAGSRDDRPLDLRPCTPNPLFRARSRRQQHLVPLKYSFQAGTLRFATALTARPRPSFASFSKTNLNRRTSLELRMDERPPASRRRRHSALPSVSSIDPSSATSTQSAFQPNDDHPPADIKDGQACARRLPRARNTPQWEGRSYHLLRRTRRLLRSRRAACGARRRPPRSDATACGYRRYRLALGGTRVCVKNTLRSHVDNEDDSPALLPGSPGRAKAASGAVGAARRLRAPPSHGNARVAGR